jgi:hypothetical protein
MQSQLLADLTLEIRKSIDIHASPQTVFETMLEQITSGMDESEQMGPNHMKLKLEPWPGGRYFRDLGNNTGHLWGHVQVIKPPLLLEITGPFFMSVPAVNHVQYRVKPIESGSTLTIVHRAFGLIEPDHRKGVDLGWQDEVDRIKKRAELKK